MLEKNGQWFNNYLGLIFFSTFCLYSFYSQFYTEFLKILVCDINKLIKPYTMLKKSGIWRNWGGAYNTQPSVTSHPQGVSPPLPFSVNYDPEQ